jgi:hypothetical protein
MKTFTFTAVTLAAAALVAPASADFGDMLYASGGEVTVEILSSSAGYTSDLSLVSPVEIYIGSNRDTGLLTSLGTFAAGTEMLFQLFVRDTEQAYFTGAAPRNPDGLIHANVVWEGPSTALVGFEDIYGGGDMDFNDCTFRFRGVVPTPGSVALFGLGGLLVARRRR